MKNTVVKDYKELKDPVDIIEYWTEKNRGIRVDIYYNSIDKTVEEKRIVYEK